MSLYDYKGKIIEFSQEIKRIIKLKLELGLESEYERILFLLHRMLFYADQFFIEQELKLRNDKESLKVIEQERFEVLQKLKSFVKSLNDGHFVDLYEIDRFLEEWNNKLSQDSIYS